MCKEFLDVDPEAVAGAGRRTAATSGDWSDWAARVETLLRDAAAGARDAAVTSEIEEHVSTLNPRLHRLAANTEAMGANATAAARLVADADDKAAAALRGPAATSHGLTGVLARPVNTGVPGPATVP